MKSMAIHGPRSAARVFLAVLSLLAGLAVAGAPVSAQKVPEKIRLTSQSKDGAVLLRVDTYPADTQLWFNKAGKSGFGSRIFVIDIPRGDGQATYVARTLAPGRYRLDSIWQQKRWGILLCRDTIEFEVAAAKITYLGKLDNRDILSILQRDAIAAGKTVSVGLSGFISDKHGQKPEFSGRDEAGLGEAIRFASEAMRASEGMVQLGALFESRVTD